MKRIEDRVRFTKEEAIKLHRELWDWLADNPSARKGEWPGWTEYNLLGYDEECIVIGECFCCHYIDQINRNCIACPLDFAPNDELMGSGSYCLGGLFGEWLNTSRDNSGERSRLAREIANLPERVYPQELLDRMNLDSRIELIVDQADFISELVGSLVHSHLQGTGKIDLAMSILGYSESERREALYDLPSEVSHFWDDGLEKMFIKTIEDIVVGNLQDIRIKDEDD